MDRKKKIVLLSWLILIINAIVVSFMVTFSFSGLIQENKDIILLTIFFIAAIAVSILWFVADYWPPGFKWMGKKRKEKIKKIKARF